MNIANKLTFLRVTLVFVFMALIWWIPGNIELNLWLALAVFIVASFTDFLDGYLARKLNLVTNLGKFMDPLADKCLVTVAMLALVDVGGLWLNYEWPAWILAIILLREFAVSGMRLIAVTKNVVVSANIWGKAKTVVQMVMIMVCLCPIQSSFMGPLGLCLTYLALVLTIISGVIYIWENKEVFKD